MSKYEPLRHHLVELTSSSWMATFAEINDVIGGDGLPPSASKHCEWWANSERNLQARAWLHAGRNVESVRPGISITFRRVSAPRPTPAATTRSVSPTGVPDPRRSKVEPTPHTWDQAGPVACDVAFHWTPLGRVELDGAGLLRFPQTPDAPGLYRFQLGRADGRGRYVGESDNLRRRFNNYRTPGPTQPTNIRIRDRLTAALKAGAEVAVAIVTSGVAVEIGGAEHPVDLGQKSTRLLLENAAIVTGGAADIESLNPVAAHV